jgi:RHS repeat-associated protein
VDSEGNLLNELRYKPFGGTIPGGSNTPTDYRYTGQRLEESLGLSDYKARFYDPTLHRFIQTDTIVPEPGNPQSLNRYIYVLNSPLKYTDPPGSSNISTFQRSCNVQTRQRAVPMHYSPFPALSVAPLYYN